MAKRSLLSEQPSYCSHHAVISLLGRNLAKVVGDYAHEKGQQDAQFFLLICLN